MCSTYSALDVVAGTLRQSMFVPRAELTIPAGAGAPISRILAFLGTKLENFGRDSGLFDEIAIRSLGTHGSCKNVTGPVRCARPCGRGRAFLLLQKCHRAFKSFRRCPPCGRGRAFLLLQKCPGLLVPVCPALRARACIFAPAKMSGSSPRHPSSAGCGARPAIWCASTQESGRSGAGALRIAVAPFFRDRGSPFPFSKSPPPGRRTRAASRPDWKVRAPPLPRSADSSTCTMPAAGRFGPAESGFRVRVLITPVDSAESHNDREDQRIPRRRSHWGRSLRSLPCTSARHQASALEFEAAAPQLRSRRHLFASRLKHLIRSSLPPAPARAPSIESSGIHLRGTTRHFKFSPGITLRDATLEVQALNS